MKIRSLLLYILVSTINVFLFLPVLFLPIIIAPLHLLLYIISYNWLFRQKAFISHWSKFIFSAIPVVAQIIMVLLYLINDTNSPPGIISLLNNLIIFVLITISLVEFVILITLYSKYLRRIS